LIVVEVKFAHKDCVEVVFEGSFCNEDIKVQVWSQIEDVSNYQ